MSVKDFTKSRNNREIQLRQLCSQAEALRKLK